MENLKDNKVFWGLIALTLFNIVFFVFGKLVIDKAADRVIQRLQKEYSPSPYGPGLDPDKISPETTGTDKVSAEVASPTKHYLGTKPTTIRLKRVEPQLQTMKGGSVAKVIAQSEDWREDWEKLRGAN